ncbi:MAG: hypothetical protein ACLFUB_18715 [Cyclobacteriaceae bacterium]
METRDRLELYQEFEHTDIFLIKDKPVLIIKASDTYIPIEEFKEVFAAASRIIENRPIQKIIFDKRRLQVFHQPSMEWYYVHWKDALLEKGIKSHRKLLPNDQVFQKSVELGKARIMEKYPRIRVAEMDIQYFDDLQEAIDK